IFPTTGASTSVLPSGPSRGSSAFSASGLASPSKRNSKMAGRLKKGSAAAAMAVALVGSFEGLRQHAYPDPATGGQPWTLCYGSTNGVKPGDYRTVAQCKALLSLELQTYAAGIERCVTVP